MIPTEALCETSARSALFQGIANLPKLLQTQGIKNREASQLNFRSDGVIGVLGSPRG